jgi:phosphoribosylformimino-5-aminoimidazole carboxamide ribotide isomerase
MEFRPCIDIHNGKVKQIVGGSLTDSGAATNFESDYDGAYYARLYAKRKLTGGHVILLNPASSEYYEADKQQALSALSATPGLLQIGGGINDSNAKEFIDAGASHIIVTSYVFKDGKINYDNINKLVSAVGRQHIVFDLSCRRKNQKYYIVTDRWQKFTDVAIDNAVLDEFSSYCDEFLIHAADVEGKCNGIEEELVRILDLWLASSDKDFAVTYAGGVGSYDDIRTLKQLSHNKINITIGSALNLFGGELDFDRILDIINE